MCIRDSCIALYSAALGIKNTRWALPAALAGDLAAFFLSALSVRSVSYTHLIN